MFTQSSDSAPNSETRYAYIDALRGIAILGVLLVHASYWVYPKTPLLGSLAAMGARGVQLFYVVSALTIFMSLSARRQEKNTYFAFFVRRFFRIAPLFYLSILIYFSYMWMEPRYWCPEGLGWWHYLSSALFINGWSPTTINAVVPGGWSIAIEMSFYLIAPLLFLYVKKIRVACVLLVVSMAFSLVSTEWVTEYFSARYPSEQQYLVKHFSFAWFFSQLPLFEFGLILYLIMNRDVAGRKVPSMELSNKELKWMHPLLCIALCVLFLLLGVYSTFAEYAFSHFVFGAAFLFLVLSMSKVRLSMLNNPVTRFLGKVSFSIYLLHLAILDTFKPWFSKSILFQGDMGFFVAFTFLLAVSAAIAFFSYRYIEQPGISLGKFLLSRYRKE